MEHEQDRDIVIALADRLLFKYKIESWSFDKGYWGKENKQLLQLEVPKVIMPKLGKRNKHEEAEETSRPFRRLKNKHSVFNKSHFIQIIYMFSEFSGIHLFKTRTLKFGKK